MNDIPGAAPQTPLPLTWDLLVVAEPQLAALLEDARAVDGSAEHFCANEVWYGRGRSRGFKGRLMRLVGWERPGLHPFLNSDLVYREAYQTIYEGLPLCRDCFCIRTPIR